jgi:hypothetical protein
MDDIQQPFKSLCQGSCLTQTCFFGASILLILVHSFYSWDHNQNGDHLVASAQQFMRSSHSHVIASAVEQAIKSCGQNHDLLCEEIIKIVWKHPLEDPTLTKTQSTAKKAIPQKVIAEDPALTKTQSTAKKTIPQKVRGWFKH